MPAQTARLRLTPAVPITIGILAGMTSCSIVTTGFRTTDVWPAPVIGGLTGYLAYLCLAALPLPAALRELARDESAPRHRSRWPWRAAVVAWLVAMVACVAFALAVMLGLPPKERGSIIDLGFGFGLFIGIPIAIGVLLLGRGEVEPASPDVQVEASPAQVETASTPVRAPVQAPASLIPVRARPGLSVEVAAAIAGLAGMSSCVMSVPWLSIWFAPPASIVFALVLFRAIVSPTPVAAGHPVATRKWWRVPAGPALASTSSLLPWRFAAGAWIACAVLPALMGFLSGTSPASVLSRVGEGLGQGALFGIPVTAWILWFARPRGKGPGKLDAAREDR